MLPACNILVLTSHQHLLHTSITCARTLQLYNADHCVKSVSFTSIVTRARRNCKQQAGQGLWQCSHGILTNLLCKIHNYLLVTGA